MRADRKPSVVLRFGGRGRGFVAVLLALLIVLTVLPISVGRAQDNQTRRDCDTLVAQDRGPEPLQRLGPLAVAPSEGLTLDRAVERLERKNLDLAAMWLEVPQARADIVSAWQRPNSVFFIGGRREAPVRLRSLDGKRSRFPARAHRGGGRA
jgi:hypothetical protein